jgi:serine/threonine protein kinase/Ca2+-binding EF-hand superfamily protein
LSCSVVHIKGAWEDDSDVHIVMELCRGGELHHSVGRRAYTEELAATYMRSVLHTLAQCHSHRILHRDVKPGNFMLLSDDEMSPLKAIDFGLAVFFDPEKLPRTDLGLDGTPWFMAPEVLNSETYPSSDLWSAGVMAYQLLSGFLPFDDVRNPSAPALSVIWKGILTEQPSFRRSAWQEVSEEAKDFVKTLLQKDHKQRPTAKEALHHPWLSKEFHATKRRPLSATVVQRIQRYAQTNILRRTILELIAGELLKMAPPRYSDASVRSGSMMAVGDADAATASLPVGGSGGGLHTSVSPPSDDQIPTSPPSSGAGDDSTHGSGVFPMSPESGGGLSALEAAGTRPPGTTAPPAGMQIPQRRQSFDGSGHGGRAYFMPGSLGKAIPRSPSMQQLATLARAANRRGVATVHGPGDYWRVLRQASELAAIASGHGQMNYLRAVPRSEEERSEARKAARLSLDTSTHGGSKYHETLARLQEADSSVRPRKLPASKSMGALSSALKDSSRTTQDANMPDASASAPLLPPSLPAVPFPPEVRDGQEVTAVPMDEDAMDSRGRGRSAAFLALAGQKIEPTEAARAPTTAPLPSGSSPMSNEEGLSLGRGPRTVKRVTFDGTTQPEANTESNRGNRIERTSSIGHMGPVAHPSELEGLMRRLQFRHDKGLDRDALAEGLRLLGYDLAPTEVDVLVSQLDVNADATVQPAEFVASQLDWGALQQDNRELWLESARRTFADLDVNSDGRLSVDKLMTKLREKLPAAEVDYAVEDALIEAGQAGAEEIDFDAFLRMLKVGSIDSLDSLDQYDARLHRGASDVAGVALPHLPPVEEEGPGLEERIVKT